MTDLSTVAPTSRVKRCWTRSTWSRKLRLQKRWGEWQSYGGGGYWINNAPGAGNQMKKHLPGYLTLLTLMVIMSAFNAVSVNAQTQQEHVHNMSHTVMPFDLAKTVHIFKMTESGGIQRVIVKDTRDTDQIMLIQHHLQMESGRFQHGDYSDPASLHGADMPGLKELQTGGHLVKVSYRALPGGAEIVFETNDLHLLTALHRWFGAQLSEHGADAKAE